MALSLNDHVQIAPDYRRPGDTGTIYKIVKVPSTAREVNYLGEPVLGGKRMRAPEYCWIAYDGPLPDPATAVVIPDMGAVVRSSNKNIVGPHVVIGTTTHEHQVKLVKLGGDGGRYWPRVHVRSLTVIDPATIVVP